MEVPIYPADYTVTNKVMSVGLLVKVPIYDEVSDHTGVSETREDKIPVPQIMV